MATKKKNRVYEFFADVLEYPTPILKGRVDKGMPLLSLFSQSAADLLEEFRVFLEETPIGRLEEIYTTTFDLQSVCYPYVGYYLFGEDLRRGIFMTKLKESYRECNFSSENELPDHICVMLRFLLKLDDEELKKELVSKCLIPALKKMTESFKENGNPYSKVVRSLLLILEEGEMRKAL